MRIALIVTLLIIFCTIPIVSADNNTNATIITVDSTNLRFSPSTVTITEGETIRFFWDGQLLPHNAVEENETFDSGDTASDQDYSFLQCIAMFTIFSKQIILCNKKIKMKSPLQR